MADHPTLVLGASGKSGRRVAHRLRARGLSVRAASRSAATPFDWEDPATWEPALRGTHAAYISYFHDPAAPGAPEAVGAFAELAVRRGVRRLVLLSGRGEDEAQAAERAVQRTGGDWTIVRASWFSQNFSEGYLREPVLAGEVALPTGDVPEPFVDVDDIADVAVAALTEAGHAGQVYEVTGPRLLTFADATAEIAQASGRRVAFERVPLEAYTAAAREQGVPDDVVGLLGYLFGEVLDGRNAHVTDGVERAVGRPARDFRDFAEHAAAAGAWDR
jgi:uncharacterized protein YbjT (DUF2867 family)